MKYILSATFLSVAVRLAGLLPVSAAGLDMKRSSNTCGDPDDAQPFYRVFKPTPADYLYLTSIDQVNGATAFAFDGVAAFVFVTQEESTVPLYRLAIGAGPTHNFYTTSTTEIATALQSGWRVAGNPFYIYPTQICGSVPFYRLYNASKGANFYTISESERLDFITNQGYIDVEVAGYVLPFMASQCA
ncbi:hypothetical protein B0H13DRAFT_2359811 [Mycena leptocephala]|nr:hypothetical protein B0H13DRAFT_2359811 [Mycena leptocephala]